MNIPPPRDLNSREILMRGASAGQGFYRSHQLVHKAVYFGTVPKYRWDAPNGEFGVLYVAFDEYTAFMESIGRNALRTRFIPTNDLMERGLSKLTLTRSLRLVDLSESGGLTRVGAEGSLTNGAGYRNSRQYSQALREHPESPDGIIYRARHDLTREAVAIYDNCKDYFAVEPSVSWADLPMLRKILDHYSFETDLPF